METTPNQEQEVLQPDNRNNMKKNDQFRDRIELCRTYRRKLIANWNVSIDYRKGKPFSTTTDSDRIAVPLDWFYTKIKQTELFSQIPKVRITHQPESTQAGPWLASYENKINDTLVLAGIEAAMDECVPDLINAAGFGVALVSYEAITEDAQVPAIDMKSLPPEVAAQALQTGQLNGEPIPMTTVPRVLDHRYVIQRISPSDFLWPIQFMGSSFDNADWVGRQGRVSWAEGVQKFNLKESDRDSVMGEDKTDVDRLTDDIEKDSTHTYDQRVGFDEIFYKEHVYDPQAKSYSTIHHLVFVNGKDEAVIDEPWKGQRLDETTNTPVGSRKYPIRVVTTAYITDEAIPPSDSAMGRPQVNEINELRTNQLLQRKRSLPVRWIDPNRVDPLILQSLLAGTWQNMVPIAGDGSRAIGEVARAAYPPEENLFVQTAQADLSNTWSVSPNSLGSGANIETKGEATEIANSVQSRVARERAKVASFIEGIAEVLGGLLALYEEPQNFGEGFDPNISSTLGYSILPDSTVILDARQRLKMINDFVNMYAKSGWVNLEPILKEAATLSGLDPNTAVKAPEPQHPDPPNISLRLTGTQDMMNPLTLAFLIKSGQAPEPELIDKARQIIQQAVAVQPPQVGPDGQPLPQGINGGSGPMPQPPPPAVGEANPEMAAMPKVTERSNNPSNTGGGQ